MVTKTMENSHGASVLKFATILPIQFEICFIQVQTKCKYMYNTPHMNVKMLSLKIQLKYMHAFM